MFGESRNMPTKTKLARPAPDSSMRALVAAHSGRLLRDTSKARKFPREPEVSDSGTKSEASNEGGIEGSQLSWIRGARGSLRHCSRLFAPASRELRNM
jgi:hypothetical protein